MHRAADERTLYVYGSNVRIALTSPVTDRLGERSAPMDSTDLYHPFLKKKMMLLTRALRRVPMGNVIHSLSLPVQSIAETRLGLMKNEGGNVSAYIRRLIEDDVTGLPDHVEAALRIQVKYLQACLAATGHNPEDFVPIDCDSVLIKEDCE